MVQAPERDFALKFSALEIYNETVVDLLNRTPGSLHLLDDPEVRFCYFLLWDTEITVSSPFNLILVIFFAKNAERDCS